jgi:hypothetical protein
MSFGQPRIHVERGPVQVRFFQEPDVGSLEAAINAWLALKPKREIVEIRQSALTVPGLGRDIIVSIWYIDN